jgi:hypothetical protein
MCGSTSPMAYVFFSLLIFSIIASYQTNNKIRFTSNLKKILFLAFFIGLATVSVLLFLFYESVFSMC